MIARTALLGAAALADEAATSTDAGAAAAATVNAELGDHMSASEYLGKFAVSVENKKCAQDHFSLIESKMVMDRKLDTCLMRCMDDTLLEQCVAVTYFPHKDGHEGTNHWCNLYRACDEFVEGGDETHSATTYVRTDISGGGGSSSSTFGMFGMAGLLIPILATAAYIYASGGIGAAISYIIDSVVSMFTDGDVSDESQYWEDEFRRFVRRVPLVGPFTAYWLGMPRKVYNSARSVFVNRHDDCQSFEEMNERAIDIDAPVTKQNGFTIKYAGAPEKSHPHHEAAKMEHAWNTTS